MNCWSFQDLGKVPGYGKPVAFILEDDIKVSRHFFAFIEEASRLVDDVDVLNFNRQNSRRAQKN